MENETVIQMAHEEARKLINLEADEGRGADVRPALDAHLRECAECRAYASGLNEVESLLRKIKRSQLPSPAPLDIVRIVRRGANPAFGFLDSPAFVKTAAMVVFLLFAAAGVWRFSNPGVPSSATAPYTIAPIPTPSTYLTVTNSDLDFTNCDFTIHQIQPGESLGDIARQFSISKELLMEFNGMTNEKIVPAAWIRIPLCMRTPTTTITITPQFKPITRTPG